MGPGRASRRASSRASRKAGWRCPARRSIASRSSTWGTRRKPSFTWSGSEGSGRRAGASSWRIRRAARALASSSTRPRSGWEPRRRGGSRPGSFRPWRAGPSSRRCPGISTLGLRTCSPPASSSPIRRFAKGSPRRSPRWATRTRVRGPGAPAGPRGGSQRRPSPCSLWRTRPPSRGAHLRCARWLPASRCWTCGSGIPPERWLDSWTRSGSRGGGGIWKRSGRWTSLCRRCGGSSSSLR